MSGDGIYRGMKQTLYMCNLEYEPQQFLLTSAALGMALAAAAGALMWGSYPPHVALAAAASVFIASEFMVYLSIVTTAGRRVAMMEEALPEFLSVMASHIRSGQTYDRALLLSARKEFGPLADEIDKVAKETLTGESLADALAHMGRRIPSPSFGKTIKMVVKGINSGGKLADLLENTALDIRKFESIKKEVAATVLVYQLFSFAATCLGAPMLYAVTVFLVKIFAAARAKIGFGQFSEPPSYLPFFQGAAISPETTWWFSVVALLVTGLFGAFTAGVIAKGKESDGLPYLPAILIISFAVFFLVNILLQEFLGGFFIV